MQKTFSGDSADRICGMASTVKIAETTNRSQLMTGTCIMYLVHNKSSFGQTKFFYIIEIDSPIKMTVTTWRNTVEVER